MRGSLALNGGEPIFLNNEGRFNWPKFDPGDERELIEQLRIAISIYDKSGIIKEFEDEFSKIHNVEFSLLSNSGTSAIFSMYESLGLKQADEVICPVYTFHATVSPLIYTGSIPVFCDCDEFGNITYDEVVKKFSKKTKAVIVTHMWGMPVADIKKIEAFCQSKKIALLEDCSHAHGATINGKLVGTFGIAAAWSLQGQKTVTGGEGGIMLTRSREIYERALLQGHYNKRPKNEINSSELLYKYYLTGLGLKLRAHPLAVCLALNQLKKLDSFLNQRRIFARRLADGLAEIPFLHVLTPPNDTEVSNYALIMRYRSDKAFGITRAQFVEALHAEGLCEVDIPGSTGLLNSLPLFVTPNEVMPRMYEKPLYQQKGFDNAERFYDEIIKLPVWTFSEDLAIIDGYIGGINKVAKYILKHESL